MCSAFAPDFGYNNISINPIGDVCCPKTKCPVNFACAKRLFNLSAEAIINARNARLCVRCAIFCFKIKQIPLSDHLVKGFTFLKRLGNELKMLLEMYFVLASIVSTERNVNRFTVL